jgi:hypothetical protein
MAKLGSLGIEFPIEAAYRGTKLAGTCKKGRNKWAGALSCKVKWG